MQDSATPRGMAVPDTAAIRALFTRSDGAYRFARWGRPLVPALFGLTEEGERIWREALRASGSIGGLALAEEDPELGVNFLVFSCNAWAELRAVPGMDRLVPDLQRLLGVLEASGANQYRIFGFAPAAAGGTDPEAPGPIRICITLLRRDDVFATMSERALALGQCVQGLLLWSDHAFTAESPVAAIEGVGRAVVTPRLQHVLRAAYAPTLPDAADDPSHAAGMAAVVQRMAGSP
ncbi:MAG: hypothetical protein AAFP17_05055 [Pseudomonadota bacterium]